MIFQLAERTYDERQVNYSAVAHPTSTKNLVLAAVLNGYPAKSRTMPNRLGTTPEIAYTSRRLHQHIFRVISDASS